MSEKTDPSLSREDIKKIEEALKAISDSLAERKKSLSIIEAIDSLSSFASKHISIWLLIFGFIGALWGGVNIWMRTNDLILMAQKRVEEVTGGLEPLSANSSVDEHDSRQTLPAIVTIEPRKAGDDTFYVVTISARILVKIVGPSGVITGTNWRYRGSVAKILSVNYDGTGTSEFRKLMFENAGSLESSELTIASDSFSTVQLSQSVSFPSCDVARSVFQQVLSATGGQEMDFQPVFKRIKKAPDFRSFHVSYEAGFALPCPK